MSVKRRCTREIFSTEINELIASIKSLRLEYIGFEVVQGGTPLILIWLFNAKTLFTLS